MVQTDEIVYVGVSSIRSDSAKVSKTIENNIMIMLLKENKSKEEVIGYVNTEKKKIIDGVYSYYEIAIPKTITDDFKNYKVKTFHVKAAEWSNKYLGTSYHQGDKIKILYGFIEGLPTCDAFAFSNEKQLAGRKIHINWKKMMKVLVENKVQRIYNALGWNEEKKQQGLGVWVK